MNAIQFSETAFFQAQQTAYRGAVTKSLVRNLGSGIENASGALLANVVSETTAKAFVASDALKSRLETEGGLDLAARMGSLQLSQQSGLRKPGALAGRSGESDRRGAEKHGWLEGLVR